MTTNYAHANINTIVDYVFTKCNQFENMTMTSRYFRRLWVFFVTWTDTAATYSL